MARMSNDEMGRILVDAVRAAGGEVPHVDLVRALKDAKLDQVLARLPALVKAGYLARQLVAQGEGPHVLVYRLPVG